SVVQREAFGLIFAQVLWLHPQDDMLEASPKDICSLVHTFAAACGFVRRVVGNSGFTGRDAAARLSGLGYVPNVQEVLVRGRSDITFGVSRSAVQGGTDVLLGVSEFGQGHPEGRTVLELVEVAQNEGNNRLMFAISRTRNFAQVHRLEVGYGSVRFQSDPPDCKR